MIRPLPKELQDIAIKELNEDPKRIQEDLKNIKEWMRQQPHLNGREDDQWIIGFLRGCKFSLQLTKTKLDNFYSLKSLWPIIVARDPFSREIQEILKLNVGIPLPNQKHSTGPKIIMSRVNELDLSVISIEWLASMVFMMNSIWLMEDENYSVSGAIFITDLKDFPLRSIVHITPSIIKNITFSLKSATPTRIKANIFLNMPPIVDVLFNTFKSLLPKKLQDRIFLYNETNIHKLYEQVPKEYLPKEYGGENGSLDEHRESFKKKVESYADWYKEDVKYCTNEFLRIGKCPLGDDLVIEGSFRKLNVD